MVKQSLTAGLIGPTLSAIAYLRKVDPDFVVTRSTREKIMKTPYWEIAHIKRVRGFGKSIKSVPIKLNTPELQVKVEQLEKEYRDEHGKSLPWKQVINAWIEEHAFASGWDGVENIMHRYEAAATPKKKSSFILEDKSLSQVQYVIEKGVDISELISETIETTKVEDVPATSMAEYGTCKDCHVISYALSVPVFHKKKQTERGYRSLTGNRLYFGDWCRKMIEAKAIELGWTTEQFAKAPENHPQELVEVPTDEPLSQVAEEPVETPSVSASDIKLAFNWNLLDSEHQALMFGNTIVGGVRKNGAGYAGYIVDKLDNERVIERAADPMSVAFKIGKMFD